MSEAGSRKRVLITAGPTWERIDAVRYIGNRSSGAMGLALAEASSARGHQVTLLLGPTSFGSADTLPGVRVERYESTADLQALLDAHFRGCDVLVMAAAVADYRPTEAQAGKRERGQPWTLTLEPTPDLVAHCAACKRPDQRVFAFALEEPAQLEARARAKLVRKGVDAIVANPLETMQSGDICGVLLWADGRIDRPPTPGPMEKRAFARWLIARLT